jgi:hypothetical protein
MRGAGDLDSGDRQQVSGAAMNEQTAANDLYHNRRRRRNSRVLGVLAFLVIVLITVASLIAVSAGLHNVPIDSIPGSPIAAASSDRASFGWFSPITISAILVALLLLAIPRIVARTGLRDRAIYSILASPCVKASSDSARFGWFSSPSVHGLRLTSTNSRVDVRVEGVSAHRSLWRLWSSALDLGTITVEKALVRLELPLDVEARKPGLHLEPTFKANVSDASIVVLLTGQDQPVIEVDGINLTFRVEKAEVGRVLTLEPVVIFDRRKVSPKLAGRLLHLFDPTMSEIPQIRGAVSLSLEKLRIPVGLTPDRVVTRMEMEGRLVLHEVSTDVSNPMRQALVQLVAVMNGKQASDAERLVQDSEIRFYVRDGRLHHEGLRFGLPDIDPELVVTSRGSVGLDKTLDLYVELPRLDRALRKVKDPARCRITGTVEEPRIVVEDGSLVLRQPGRTEPVIAADGINLNMRVEPTATGRVLAVEPVEVFKKRKLSLGVAAGLVKLLAPDIRSDREVDGEISLSFETLNLPLGLPREQEFKQLEAAGKLTLHRVSSEVLSPVWRALIRLVADMNGGPPSGVIRLVADAEVYFRIKEGRLYHEGLRIGFPDVDPDLVVSSRGSIGMDETLSLDLEMPRLRKSMRNKDPLRCHVAGTIGQPTIAILNAPLFFRYGMVRGFMRVYPWARRHTLLTGSLPRAARWATIGLEHLAVLPGNFLQGVGSAVAGISALRSMLRRNGQ